jgi:hypothetical protein
MVVEVQHRRLMLLCTCCDEKVRDRQTMPAAPAELLLSADGRRDRLGVHAQFAKRCQVVLDPLVLTEIGTGVIL